MIVKWGTVRTSRNPQDELGTTRTDESPSSHAASDRGDEGAPKAGPFSTELTPT